jgi:hypothetical protein
VANVEYWSEAAVIVVFCQFLITSFCHVNYRPRKFTELASSVEKNIE